MDHKFLDYYNKELTFMREMAREFADKHPKIAGRLGMRGIEVADPYVERLIESFCFMSARTQLKLDAEFPLFTHRLLDIVYPNYTAPTPSMGVIQLQPNLKEGNLTQGYRVPRHSAFFTAIAPGEITRCEFRSGQDVQLWPLEITEARLTSIPPDIPNLDRHRISQSRLKSALRIKLRLQGDLTFSQLEGLERLPIYIDGDERIVSHIFELIHASHVATIVRAGKGEKAKDTIIGDEPLSFEGLSPDQSLLPVAWNIFHGHNLVQEYFSCRQRFYFFTLNKLADGLKHNNTNEAEIIILLDRLDQSLAGHVSASRFLLHCTPVINLFPRRMDKLEINRALNEFHVIPDRSRPLDFEIYSISKVFGQLAETSKEVVFNPLYQTRHSDNGNFGRYFSITRKHRQDNSSARKYDTRTAYTGTEVFVSLVDQQEAPYSDDIRYLSIDAMATNRDLPRLIAASGNFSLTMPDSAPIHGARFVFQPSAPRPPFANGESAWRLIRQLSFNYLPLSDMTHSKGGESLRNMLRLFVSSSDHDSNTQIDALVGCHSEPVIRRLPGNGLLIYGRGVRCTLTVDEDGFSGISPYLFGMIMENYFARHAAINVFTETELLSMQRGKVGQWKARPGRRGVL
ncbi:type VI secretion system baseplate subunit TssF [Serratia sp. UGAL515B_01]|uniref:type VI secretion system baseplate subunit TssF n=1 Tax=Serratia sp. UGAL515B_01 TaxID=2986763 RepID=UPI00295350DC|nr:type VI secretion system baseplate subunit TssF [Serratia sp. UGAL515B_01]WON77477.1 type VI secretion system baseplate subunit TssF [Serratia sp. UGAL515B_01]